MASRITTFIVYVALPILGMLFLGWDWRSIILLYWLENVTVGIRNVISMIRTVRVSDPGEQPMIVNGQPVTSTRAKPMLVLFFMFHYELFTVVHGVFVLLIVSGVFSFFGGRPDGFGAGGLGGLDMPGILLVWGVGSIVQIVIDGFTSRSELPSVSTLFWRPYRRIIALHVTILGGAWLIARFDWPPIAAILLVALHFVTDLWNPAEKRGEATASV